MDYYELTIKIPRLRRSWFRYRLRTLLLLMLLVAIAATIWNVRTASAPQRLMRRLEQSKVHRGAALQQWRRAARTFKLGGDAAKDEAEARAKYFTHRNEIEGLLRQIAAKSG